ncbi:DUF1194 domain-containing protein [Ensifer sp. ENS06]|nr:DUF1194 domain-containing protein [Ensifer sp. ENS06]
MNASCPSPRCDGLYQKLEEDQGLRSSTNSTVPLDQYYAECAIGGGGSFIIPVRKARDFASAIRRKLLLEVSGLTPGWTPQPAAVTPPVDCLIGEKYPGFLEPAFRNLFIQLLPVLLR